MVGALLMPVKQHGWLIGGASMVSRLMMLAWSAD